MSVVEIEIDDETTGGTHTNERPTISASLQMNLNSRALCTEDGARWSAVYLASSCVD